MTSDQPIQEPGGYPLGYTEASERYARLVRRAFREGRGPGKLTEAGRWLGMAWSERYMLRERATALAKASEILTSLEASGE